MDINEKQSSAQQCEKKHLQKLVADFPNIRNRQPIQLAEQVRGVYEYLTGLDAAIITNEEDGALYMISAGYALAAMQQQLPDGEWEKFIKLQIKGISRATVFRYKACAAVYPDPLKIPENLTRRQLNARVRENAKSRRPQAQSKRAALAFMKLLRGFKSQITKMASGGIPKELELQKASRELELCLEGLRVLKEKCSPNIARPQSAEAGCTPPPCAVPQRPQTSGSMYS